MIEAHNLTKHYCNGGETLTVLDAVSLRVELGEIVALHGPSGSGKTTLLKLLAGVVEPDEGEVLFDCVNIAKLKRTAADRYRLQELGFVLQRPRLVAGMSAIENAALRLMSCGMSRLEAQRAVLPMLEQLDLGGIVDRPVRALSQGQRQRIAITAALSTQPRLVIADEPTGSLDSHNGGRVLSLLAETCKEQGVAVLVATHDPQVCAVSDRSLELCDARLAESKGVAGW